MSVEDLNHVNIRAPADLLKQVRDFYVDVLGLHEGDRPGIAQGGYWLYAGDKPIVHLADGEFMGDTAVYQNTGNLDHVAFTCIDIDAMQERFERSGRKFLRRDFPEYGFAQLVLTDPIGLDIELNFQLR